MTFEDYLTKQIRTKLLTFIFHLTLSKFDTDDIYQQTLYLAFRFFDRFDGNNFHAWIFKIAKNQFYNMKRSKYADKNLYRFEHDEDFELSDGQEFENSFLETVDKPYRIEKLFIGLNESQKELLNMKYIDGMKQEEIAGVLRIPHGTVKSRIFRAEEQIRINKGRDKC